MSKLLHHPFGKPVNILNVLDSKEIIVNGTELGEIFTHPSIQDRKIVIFSVIGAFRGGKSYLLDYCLRFLYVHYASIKNPDKETQFLFQNDDNWMGKADDPLAGFSWRSGSKRDTTGILVWNDVFLHTVTSSGEKIAIFVMDTQGLFDSESTPADNSRIFSLGTLMSSIQVINTMNRIQEDELQYLQFATELTQFSARKLKNVKGKSFQNLIFLVRDWNNDDEYKYGVKGGEEYINDVLKIKSNQKPELRSVRETVRDSFENIQCCLLPYPGKDVAGTKNYDGRWSRIDDEFKSELKAFVEHLLMPENLIIKKINNVDVTVNQIHQLTKDYFQLFSSNRVPEPSSIHELTVESYMNNLIDKSITKYKLTVYRNADLITKENMPILHEKCKERSLKLYKKEIKMGNVETVERFKAKLSEEIDNIFEYFKDLNDKKIEEFEKESQRLYALLEREQHQRLDAEIALRSIKMRMKELGENRNQMEPEIYKKHKLMLEANEYAEQLKIENYDNIQKEEFDFRKALSLAAGISLVAASILAPNSFVAIISNMLKVTTKFSMAVKAVDEVCTNVKKTINNCSIM